MIHFIKLTFLFFRKLSKHRDESPVKGGSESEKVRQLQDELDKMSQQLQNQAGGEGQGESSKGQSGQSKSEPEGRGRGRQPKDSQVS